MTWGNLPYCQTSRMIRIVTFDESNDGKTTFLRSEFSKDFQRYLWLALYITSPLWFAALFFDYIRTIEVKSELIFVFHSVIKSRCIRYFSRKWFCIWIINYAQVISYSKLGSSNSRTICPSIVGIEKITLAKG